MQCQHRPNGQVSRNKCCLPQTNALQAFYRQGWTLRANLLIDNHPSAPEDTPVFTGPQRREENITLVLQIDWYCLLADVMYNFSFSLLDSTMLDRCEFWSSVFLQSCKFSLNIHIGILTTKLSLTDCMLCLLVSPFLLQYSPMSL